MYKKYELFTIKGIDMKLLSRKQGQHSSLKKGNAYLFEEARYLLFFVLCKILSVNFLKIFCGDFVMHKTFLMCSKFCHFYGWVL